MKASTSSPSAEVSGESADWSPKRCDLRYTFVAKIELTDTSGKRVVGVTSNLSRYGCHIRTTTPLIPGTMVRLRIMQGGSSFATEGKIVYAVSGDGMGVHFHNVPVTDRALLKRWLVELGASELEQRLRRTRETHPSKLQKLIVLGAMIVVLVTGVIVSLAWFGVLR